MRFLDDYRERRDQQWWERHHREHRWDVLGKYNAECHRGIVHTAEYVALMAKEQSQFNAEQANPAFGDGRLLPLERGHS